MLKIILIILGLVVVAVIGIVAFASTKPDSFIIQRSTTIDAPPAKVYALIQDFRQWSAWSPFEKLDADMKRSYGEPAAGLGGTYGWEGKKAGSGTMRIRQADPDRRVVIALDFTKPFPASNTATFELEPVGEGTRVTWAMSGQSPLMFKVMDTLMGMDKTVGRDFEKGLADLKAAAEK
ncbi:MAG: SRPBCC family protein [Caulobacter sp.]|nr:SRPBCC family protein [Caulobacter sp.]